MKGEYISGVKQNFSIQNCHCKVKDLTLKGVCKIPFPGSSFHWQVLFCCMPFQFPTGYVFTALSLLALLDLNAQAGQQWVKMYLSKAATDTCASLTNLLDTVYSILGKVLFVTELWVLCLGCSCWQGAAEIEVRHIVGGMKERRACPQTCFWWQHVLSSCSVFQLSCDLPSFRAPSSSTGLGEVTAKY